MVDIKRTGVGGKNASPASKRFVSNVTAPKHSAPTKIKHEGTSC